MCIGVLESELRYVAFKDSLSYIITQKSFNWQSGRVATTEAIFYDYDDVN